MFHCGPGFLREPSRVAGSIQVRPPVRDATDFDYVAVSVHHGARVMHFAGGTLVLPPYVLSASPAITKTIWREAPGG